jgi:hypothetical protein
MRLTKRHRPPTVAMTPPRSRLVRPVAHHDPITLWLWQTFPPHLLTNVEITFIVVLRLRN